ncbi:MAG: pyridoxal phosphate-dependent aminotransferase [Treponemataceae bacterium]
MKYDFITLPNRREQPSNKWRAALKKMDLPEGVIPFTTADMEFKMPPEIISGLKEFLDTMILGYTYADEGFLSAVYSWMKERHGFEIKPEWIVTTTGVVPAFFTAIKTLTKKGDGVVIMPPVYPPFFLSAKKQARDLIECPLVSDNKGYYEIDFDRFKKICKTKKPKILLFCSPHNPVGRVWKKSELEKLAEICLEYNVFMLVDEIHHDLILPGHKHTVLQTIAPELSKHIITHTSLSKTFNLAGMMLSVNFIPDENLRERFNTETGKMGMHMCTALGFKAYEIAYTKCAGWLDEVLKVIDTNMHLVSESLAETKIKAPLFEGTYLQWLNCRELKMSDEELAKFLQNKALLFLNEGQTFGKEGSGFARWNLAAPTEIIKKAVERLKKHL